MKIELAQDKPWKKWTGITLFILSIAYAAMAASGKSTKSLDLASLSFQPLKMVQWISIPVLTENLHPLRNVS